MRGIHNAVYGYSCRYTVYHTQSNKHLDQNIGLNKHKLSLSINGNTAECNVSQEKKAAITKLSTMALYA